MAGEAPWRPGLRARDAFRLNMNFSSNARIIGKAVITLRAGRSDISRARYFDYGQVIYRHADLLPTMMRRCLMIFDAAAGRCRQEELIGHAMPSRRHDNLMPLLFSPADGLFRAAGALRCSQDSLMLFHALAAISGR